MQTLYEPFTAHFTGALSVFHSNDGRRWIFKEQRPRIVKGQAYMLRLDNATGTCRLLVVVPPASATGHAS